MDDNHSTRSSKSSGRPRSRSNSNQTDDDGTSHHEPVVLSQSEHASKRKRSAGSSSSAPSSSSRTTVAKNLSSWRGSIRPKSKAALMVRASLVLLLVSSAIVVSLLVYRYTTEQERNEFETEFQSDADKVFVSIGATFDHTLAAADNFVATLVAHKDATNGSFPFVALANFPLQAAKAKSLSRAYHAQVHYLVSEDQRTAWEDFALQNNQFVGQAWNLQAVDPSFTGPLDSYPTVQAQLYDYVGPAVTRDNHLVAWQNYPILGGEEAPYNFDVLAVPSLARQWLPVLQSKMPTISDFSNLLDPTQARTPTEQILVDHLQNFIPEGESADEPIFQIIYPVIDQTKSLQVDNEAVTDEEFVGTLSFFLFWRDLLQNMLPDKSEGIFVVTETTCAQSFTHEINGPNTKHKSIRDVHDSNYDYLQEVRSFEDILKQSASDNRFYSGVPLSDAPCSLTIKVSPSQRYEDIYVTNNPKVFAVSAGLIFVLAGGLFLLYDYLVDLGRKEK